jgi:hypothetical protein
VVFSAIELLVLGITVYLCYIGLRSKKVSYTGVYLSGEGEEVVSELTPSVGGLYWAFIRQYARRIYKLILERVQTGSLSDWFYYISSWLGLLVLLSVILSLLYLFAR